MSGEIAILLPTYNGAAHLAEQLESLFAQTFGDFELIIVDDGSTDETPVLLRRFAALDRRVRLLESSGNAGQKARLLALLQASRAPLIAISDQDDIWAPDKIERLRDAIGGRALAFGRSDLIDGTGHTLGRTALDAFGPAPRPGDRLTLLFRPQVSGHALLARRETVDPAAFRRLHHYDWLISLDAAFSDGIVYVEEAVVSHRLHGANQANAGLAADANLGPRGRLGAAFDALSEIARDRVALTERLEHLAFSSIVPPATAAVALRLARACRQSWLERTIAHPAEQRRLRALMLDLLEPLSGSPEDLATARMQVARLTGGGPARAGLRAVRALFGR